MQLKVNFDTEFSAAMKLLPTRFVLIFSLSLTFVSSCFSQTTRNEDEPTTPAPTTIYPTSSPTTIGPTPTTVGPTPETTTQAGDECKVAGECPGSVAGFSFTPTSIEECQEYCGGFPDLDPPITWVTYSIEKNFCECFQDCGGDPVVKPDCPDCESSKLECVLEGCFIEGLCTNVFIHFYSKNILKDCVEACKEDNECAYFSFNRDRKICLLFGKCDTFDDGDPTFVTGQSTCVYPNPYHILVTTGFPLATSVKSEIIDIRNPESTCTDFPASPIQNQNAFGTFLANAPVICGGDGGKQSCYTLGSDGPGEILLKERISSASAMSGNQLAIFGGSPLSATANSSSNTFEVCQTSTLECSLNDLPFSIKEHCMVSINEGYTVIIGGKTGESDSKSETSNKVFLLDLQGGLGELPAKLIDGRASMGCAVINTIGFDNNPTKALVVVGGIGEDGKNVKDVEMMIQGQPFFFRGPRIKNENNETVALNSLQLVSLGDSVVAIGGKDDSKAAQSAIYQLSCPDLNDLDKCAWTQLEQKLQVPRSNFVAMPIDYEFVECT